MTLFYRTGVVLLLMSLFTLAANAQGLRDFTGITVDRSDYEQVLNDQFNEYWVVKLPLDELDEWVQSPEYDYKLNLNIPGLKQWDISLFPHDIKGRNYKLRTSQGEISSPKVISFIGHVGKGGDSDVRLVIDNSYLGGLIDDGQSIWYVEPLFRYHKGTSRDLFVIYEEKSVIPREESGCLALETGAFLQRQIEKEDEKLPGVIEGEGQVLMQCRETQVATAHDKFMFDSYGSVSACESHAIAVMNNVATNWDNEFADEIQFYISEQFVEQNNLAWPTSSTNAGAVLSAFRSWANGGGFSGPYDLGQIWTDRDFAGGTIGVAYLSAVCTGSRYHALQDFSNNASLLRVLTSHEIGHNFSCTHDPSGAPFIMAPSVNNSNAWSNQSISQVNNFVPGAGCLAPCASSQPPIANFTADITMGCAPLTVQFTDQSGGGAPSSWSWSFPGGTPSSSTQQNPVVTYNSAGSFDVSLTVSNAGGSDTRTINNYIEVQATPLADFIYYTNELLVDFTSISVDADLLTWDFGDGTNPITGDPNQSIPGGTHQGNTTGTYGSPTHLYDMDGTYVVTLTAQNNCGTDVYQQAVTVVSPVSADFTSDITNGCADLVVNFESQSSANVTQWSWEFPGGSPSTSTQQNPTVTYDTEGNYTVILEVSNSGYVDRIEKVNYITVLDRPIAGFNYQVNNMTVSFTNTTQNSNSLLWDFGDGTISNLQNPIHTYSQDSIYTVMLIATNVCGNDTATIDITVGSPPVAAFSSDVTDGCAPLNVQFLNLSSPNATRWEWEFEGGTPATSTQAEPLVTYNSPGAFDVTMIAINGLGADTVTLTDYITVEPLPEAEYSSLIDSNRVDFTNLSSYGESYEWDFGDGTTSNAFNAFHVYDDDGVYTVRLTVENDCGVDIYETTVTIATNPLALFTQNLTSGCAPLTVMFENQSSENSTNFEWQFEGGTPSSSTQENPVVIFNSPGAFDVTLIAFNAQGSDTLEMQELIVVNDVPEADFNTIPSMATIEFINTSLRGDSYTWNFGDGDSSMEENPVHMYEGNGTYEVWLIVENECGVDSVSTSIEINAYPVALFGSNTTSGCGPLEVQFNSMSQQADSLIWEFEGGNPATSNDPSPVVEYTVPGIYEVQLIAINTLGADTSIQQNYIEVFPETEAEFSFAVNGYIVDFINESTNATTYMWDFGDGNTSSEQDPDHEYEDEGNYIVQLISEGVCGIDTVSYQVEIIDLSPSVSISLSASMGCAPMTINFMDESSNNPTSWLWEFEGGDPSTSTEQDPVVTYNDPGVYRVTLEVTNMFGTSKAIYDGLITVLPEPVSDFSFTQNADTITLQNTSSNYNTIVWDFGDGNTSTEENPMHVYDSNGVYNVMLVVFNDCGSDTTIQQVTVSVSGVFTPQELGEFKVFPNPNQGVFTILLKDRDIVDDIQLEIVDLLGRSVFRQSIDAYSLQNGYLLQLPSSEPGTYFVTLRKGERISFERIAIMK